MRGVYKITNTVNGKIYVGESLDIMKRWKSHKYDLAKGKHHSYKLQADYNKYGADVFKFEIICTLDESIPNFIDKFILIYLESEGISYYHSISKGYNIVNTATEIYEKGGKDSMFLKCVKKRFEDGVYGVKDKVIYKNLYILSDLMKKLGVKNNSKLSAMLLEKGVLYRSCKDRKYKWNPKFIEWNDKYNKVKFTKEQFDNILEFILSFGW